MKKLENFLSMTREASLEVITNKILRNKPTEKDHKALAVAQDALLGPEVVFCVECEKHGNCPVEYIFNFAGLSKGFCAAGKSR